LTSTGCWQRWVERGCEKTDTVPDTRCKRLDLDRDHIVDSPAARAATCQGVTLQAIILPVDPLTRGVLIIRLEPVEQLARLGRVQGSAATQVIGVVGEVVLPAHANTRDELPCDGWVGCEGRVEAGLGDRRQARATILLHGGHGAGAGRQDGYEPDDNPSH